MSSWWRGTIHGWYKTGRRQLVVRAGRRAGKSSSLTRLAVCEALYGRHDVPPGDIGIVAIISARREDATERLRTVTAILDAIGVKYVERGDFVELVGRRVGFRVYTATVAGVSGFTSVFVLCDEVAKWRDSSTGTNPAAVVIKSVRPTVATQKNARMVLSSSPMGLLDAHADAFALGGTTLQVVAHAPTWVANPTLTEQDTHDLEPDEADWEREYAAIPQAEAETSLLRASTLDEVTRATGDLEPDDRHTYVATIDPATRGNSWTLVVATLSDNHRRRIVLTREWRGTKDKPLSPGATFCEIAALILPYRLRHIYSDQFAEDAMRELARPHGLSMVVQPWTASRKADAYDGLRQLIAERRVDLPANANVRTDLLGIRVRLTRSGVVYELAEQGARHSDFAPAIAMAVDLCKVPATVVRSALSVEEVARKQKEEFLMQRQKERQRDARFGRRPPTHRR
jgi:hypothetical protein